MTDIGTLITVDETETEHLEELQELIEESDKFMWYVDDFYRHSSQLKKGKHDIIIARIEDDD